LLSTSGVILRGCRPGRPSGLRRLLQDLRLQQLNLPLPLTPEDAKQRPHGENEERDENPAHVIIIGRKDGGGEQFDPMT
jgi:hypothetical protein